MTVGGKSVLMTEEKDPAKIPWGKLGVDVVVESTGVLLTREKLAGHGPHDWTTAPASPRLR